MLKSNTFGKRWNFVEQIVNKFVVNLGKRNPYGKLDIALSLEEFEERIFLGTEELRSSGSKSNGNLTPTDWSLQIRQSEVLPYIIYQIPTEE